jgi:hypothetical protein
MSISIGSASLSLLRGITMGLVAVGCGGAFNTSHEGDPAGGGGGGGADIPDSGIVKADATVPVDGNNPKCPATPPEARQVCSEYLGCKYIHPDGCPQQFVCSFENGVTGVTVGGPPPPIVWLLLPPGNDVACRTPGQICQYDYDHYSIRVVCTEGRVWGSAPDPGQGTTSMTTAPGSTSITTGGGSASVGTVTVGTGGAGGEGGAGGSGGAARTADAGPE